MDFARFRHRMSVLLTLGALALAALLAGGCAAPDDGERARFAVVTGVVLDNNNNPVAGALVSVVDPLENPVAGGPLGTRNFFGSPGPFVTDASGRFFIPGVKVAETAPGVVVLNLQATAPGFLPSTVVVEAPRSATILGRDFIAGVQTQDIVITQDVVSGLVARLVPPGQTVTVGAGGIQNLAVAVTDAATGVTTTTATINIPAGAIQTDRPVQLAVTGLAGTSLASVAAPTPSRVPTVGSPAPPQTNAGLGSGIVPATIALGAVDIRSLGAAVSFTGPKPTVSFPLPGGLVVTSLSSRQIPSNLLAVVYFNETTGAWELVPNANPTVANGVVTFEIGEPTGTYALVVPATWSLPTGVRGESVLFPPIAGFPNGYVSLGRLSQSLNFGESGQTEAFLRTAYSALTGEVANGPFVVQVPSGTTTGRSCTRVTGNVAVTFGNESFDGTRSTWDCVDVTVPQVPAIPAHLQGHVQGVASGN